MEIWRIFAQKDLQELHNFEKENTNDYLGVFYVLEYGDTIKIGSSKKPYTRLMSLRRNAEKYGNITLGRMAISKLHTNYFSNEKVIHKKLDSLRKNGTELFFVGFEETLKAIEDMHLPFLDETKKIKKESKDFCDFMGNLLFGNLIKTKK